MASRFTTGTYISAVGHTGLIVWLLAGWGLSHEPLPFEVTEVSVISGEEYAAIVAATTPDPATELDAAPVAPAVDETPPPPTEETPPDVTQPDAAPEAPPEEAPPPPTPDPIPVPAEVTDAPPDQPAQLLPPPSPEINLDVRPQPRPADRIAAEPTAPPPPEADEAPEVQQEVSPDATAEAVVVPEETDAAAPPETATEIVTEAEEPSGAVETSLRPMTRPNRPPPATETPPDIETASADVSDDINALLGDVAASDTSTDTPSETGSPAANPGPPMTGGEKDAFRVAVQGCWVVDPGAQAAGVTVTIVFELDRQGRVTSGPDLLTSSGGTPGVVNAAFESAARAVNRCGRDGFSLPEDKYDQWRVVEMTFDPSGMRLR